MKKILILSANPKDTRQLRLNEEVREIDEALKLSKNRDSFKIITKLAVRVNDLRRQLLEHEPNIVHFSGHGSGSDGLALENNDGQIQLVSTQALSRLFNFFQNKIECIVLNACYSEIQAEAIHQYIDCVVGMNNAIGDGAAIEFATGFYDALGAGRGYYDCFQLGCTSIDLEGIPESQTPQIKIRERLSPSLANNNNKKPESSESEEKQKSSQSLVISGSQISGQVGQAGRNLIQNQNNNHDESQKQLTPNQVIGLIEKSNKKVHRLVIILDGINYDKFISDKDIQAAVSLLLQKASGDTSVNIEKIEEGSIKITLDGSPEALKRLADLIQSGELGELKEELQELGLSIKDAKLVAKDATEENENTEDDESHLVHEILENGAHERDLSSVDLNDANLSDADLNGALRKDLAMRVERFNSVEAVGKEPGSKHNELSTTLASQNLKIQNNSIQDARIGQAGRDLNQIQTQNIYYIKRFFQLLSQQALKGSIVGVVIGLSLIVISHRIHDFFNFQGDYTQPARYGELICAIFVGIYSSLFCGHLIGRKSIKVFLGVLVFIITLFVLPSVRQFFLSISEAFFDRNTADIISYSISYAIICVLSGGVIEIIAEMRQINRRES